MNMLLLMIFLLLSILPACSQAVLQGDKTPLELQNKLTQEHLKLEELDKAAAQISLPSDSPPQWIKDQKLLLIEYYRQSACLVRRLDHDVNDLQKIAQTVVPASRAALETKLRQTQAERDSARREMALRRRLLVWITGDESVIRLEEGTCDSMAPK